jgi:hypothetical protein
MWLGLLASGAVETGIFHVKAKFRVRSRERRPYNHTQTYATHSQRRQRRELEVEMERGAPAYSRGLSPSAVSHHEGSMIKWRNENDGVAKDRTKRALPSEVDRYHGRSGVHINSGRTRQSAPAQPRADYFGDARQNNETSERAEGRPYGKSQAQGDEPPDGFYTSRTRRGYQAEPTGDLVPRGSGRDTGGSQRRRVPEPDMPARKSSGAVTAPFFTWQVRSDKDTAGVRVGYEARSGRRLTATEATNKNVARILARINESLTADRSGVGELYSRAYTCTKENLLERHPYLTRRALQKGGTEQGHPDQTKGGHAGDKEGSPTRAPDSRQPDPQPSNDHPPPAVSLLHQAEALSRQLFDISDAIIGEFIPMDEHWRHHVVCTRFWGTVDEHLRVR